MANLSGNFQTRIICHLENRDAFPYDLVKALTQTTSDPDFLKAGLYNMQCQSICLINYIHTLERHDNHQYGVTNTVSFQEVGFFKKPSSLRLCETYLQIHKKGYIRFHLCFLQPRIQAALLFQQSSVKPARAFVSHPSPAVISLLQDGVQHLLHIIGTAPVPTKQVLSAGAAQSQGLSRGLFNFTHTHTSSFLISTYRDI